MDRNRDIIPRSFFQAPLSFFSSAFPSSWGDAEDKMSQWFGGETGVTVSEDEQNVYVEANLPGLNPEDLDISLDRNTLRIKGEKKEEIQEGKNKKFYRRAQRSFFYQVELPTQVEEDSEQAHYENGVLHVTFKKSQRDAVKKIAVGKGSQRGGAQQQQQQQQKGSQQKNTQHNK